MHYRGFTARVYYDEEEGEIIGHVPTTHGGLDFRVTSFGAVEPHFKALIDKYLEDHPETEPAAPVSQRS
ncbi:MAG: hypothetical protein EA356_01580 [Geminicoccaceae bacterium]|nr:MAG: hypothetical protein EA356_01580 [Geminicoccaceae bacterium]